jgi:hypothetical protein
MNPEEAEHVAKNVMKTAHLDQTNPYARKFQCPLNSTPMTAQAEILAPPAIAYAGNVIEQPQHDGRLQWNPPENRKYLINGRVDKWLVVNYNRCVKDDRVLK